MPHLPHVTGSSELSSHCHHDWIHLVRSHPIIRPYQAPRSCECRQTTGYTDKTQTFQAQGGVMAAEAIALLQDFYACGNPNGTGMAPAYESCI